MFHPNPKQVNIFYLRLWGSDMGILFVQSNWTYLVIIQIIICFIHFPSIFMFLIFVLIFLTSQKFFPIIFLVNGLFYFMN